MNDYKPLLLPMRSEDFEPGRQYALTPLARLILRKEFGIAGVPTIVECIARKVAPTKIETVRTNLVTGEYSVNTMWLDAQEATFSVFMGYGRPKLKFTLDIEKLDHFAPFYDGSHKLPGDLNKHNAEMLAKLEQDWFDNSSLPPIHHKFRGCSLRWWMKSNDQVGTAARISASAPRARVKIDLSCLD